MNISIKGSDTFCMYPEHSLYTELCNIVKNMKANNESKNTVSQLPDAEKFQLLNLS